MYIFHVLFHVVYTPPMNSDQVLACTALPYSPRVVSETPTLRPGLPSPVSVWAKLDVQALPVFLSWSPASTLWVWCGQDSDMVLRVHLQWACLGALPGQKAGPMGPRKSRESLLLTFLLAFLLDEFSKLSF